MCVCVCINTLSQSNHSFPSIIRTPHGMDLRVPTNKNKQMFI